MMFTCLWLATIRTFAAEPVTREDRAQIQAQIDRLGVGMRDADGSAMVQVLPPRMRAAIAALFGATEAELEQALRAQVAATMAEVRIKSFGMKLKDATTHTTPDGARTYLLIPTFVVLKLPGASTTRTSAETLALEDDGAWYLLRLDPGQQSLLYQVYPEFEHAELPFR